ncbi:MAG: lysophospholipid acyltransferase family protein [Acetobacteraceae bacterium]|nr:lysophospholipid acyltransferase family protein [Acetobacteraceae bacterium]
MPKSRMLKRALRSAFVQALAARLVAAYLAFVFRTSRWTLIGVPHAEAAVARGGRVVIGFWHERLPLMPVVWRIARQRYPELGSLRPHVLVSRSRDGRFIGEVVSRFGLSLVHASSSSGGGVGLLALARLIEQGAPVAVTPDGPRGPRRVAAPGIAQLAAVSGVPVLPVGAATTRHRLLPSWDRMMLPLPFGQGCVALGPLIEVPEGGAEAALPAIADALTAACDAADSWVAAGGRGA